MKPKFAGNTTEILRLTARSTMLDTPESPSDKKFVTEKQVIQYFKVKDPLINNLNLQGTRKIEGCYLNFYLDFSLLSIVKDIGDAKTNLFKQLFEETSPLTFDEYSISVPVKLTKCYGVCNSMVGKIRTYTFQVIHPLYNKPSEVIQWFDSNTHLQVLDTCSNLYTTLEGCIQKCNKQNTNRQLKRDLTFLNEVIPTFIEPLNILIQRGVLKW